MDKPKPKKELAVLTRCTYKKSDSYAVIQVTTPDAKLWLEENAPEFGELRQWDDIPGRYHFEVPQALYDFDEVLNYIGSMGVNNNK